MTPSWGEKALCIAFCFRAQNRAIAVLFKALADLAQYFFLAYS